MSEQMKTLVKLELSVDALYTVVRGVADRGEDYGWNVYYYRGNEVPAEERRDLVVFDDGAAHWLEAWDAVLAAYKTATGEDWYY